VKGWALEVRVVPERRTFMVGEPIYMTFKVRNSSVVDLLLPEGGDYRNRLGRPNRYRCVVQPRGGKPLPLVDSGPAFGGISSNRQLPAGGAFARELFLPTCSRPLEVIRFTPNARPSWQLKGPRVTARASVTVTPTDAGRMGTLIQELGGLLLAANSEHARKAGQALATIHDPRAVAHWIKALETRGYGVKLQAIRALGAFKSDAALGGLKHCRADRNTNVRQTCAQALAESPHPKAWPALLSMKADSYQGVRLTVLHALAKRPCAQAARLLRQMAKDRDRVVRGEAQRYLKRCRKPCRIAH
jgi:hypothetical protein